MSNLTEHLKTKSHKVDFNEYKIENSTDKDAIHNILSSLKYKNDKKG